MQAIIGSRILSVILSSRSSFRGTLCSITSAFSNPQPHAVRFAASCQPPAFITSSPEDSDMGCSSGRHPPAPVLHPDLECGNSSGEAKTLPQDSDNQNRGLNGCGEEGEGSFGGGHSAKPPESLPTLEKLAQATGGTEKSWYRCVFPFGVISLVIGMAGTGVTFKFNTLLQTKVVSVALLCAGMVMLLVAAVCWRAHRLRRRKKKEGGFFITDQGTL